MGFIEIALGLPGVIGEIDNTLFSDSSAWSRVGNNDYTFGSGLDIVGSNTSAFDKYITLNNSYSNFRNLTITCHFTVKDVSSTSNGFGIGRKSVNTWFALNSILNIRTRSGFITAKREVTGGVTETVNLSAINLACSVNDKCIVIYQNYQNAGSVTVINATQGTKVTDYIAYDPYPNSALLGVWSCGGTHKIDKVVTETPYSSKCAHLFGGDSITIANGAASSLTSYPYLCGRKVNDFAICAGSGDRSTELVLCLPNMLKTAPAKATFLIGTNDEASSVTQVSWLANLTTIKNAFNAIGTDVYFSYLLPKNSADVSSRNSALAAAFPGKTIATTYTVFLATSGTGINPALSADGLHPNAAGNILLANKVIEFHNL